MNKKTKIAFNVLAIICIIIFSAAVAPKTLQNDTYYTIKTGETIIQNGIDGQDHFSWSDLKYTYPHWLYDVGIYLVYHVRWYDWNLYINYCIKLYFGNYDICNK